MCIEMHASFDRFMKISLIPRPVLQEIWNFLSFESGQSNRILALKKKVCKQLHVVIKYKVSVFLVETKLL